VARPKSAILICLFLMRILAGLISLCRNPLEVKKQQADIICSEKAMIYEWFGLNK